MRLFKFLLEHKLALISVFVLLAAQALLELALPTYTSNIVDVGIAQCVDASGNLQLDYILQMGALMMFTTLGILLTNLLADLISSRTGAKIGHDLREKLFQKITEFSKVEIDKFSSATLITRGTNDIQNIQMACVLTQRMVLYSPIMAAGGIFAVSQSNLSMVWIIVLGVLVVVFCVVALMGITMPKFKMMQKLIDRVNLIAREILTGLPVVRAFGRESYEENRFDCASKNLRNTQLFTNRVMTFMMPVMMLMMNLMSILIVWVGGHAINDGTLQTGEMIAYITYSMIIVSSFLMLGMVAVVLPRANVAANRVWDVITCEASIKDGVCASETNAQKESTRAKSNQDSNANTNSSKHTNTSTSTNAGAQNPVNSTACPFVEFDNVSFHYAGAKKDLLCNVSFSVEAGKTTAIVGSTGCGKSTIIQLIERFYDVSKGVVRVCGQDVRDMQLQDLREKFGYVSQKAFLFSGTVESNVMYGAKCDEEQKEVVLHQSLEIAQAVEFVDSLEKKEKSPISQGGTNVSGGQRQRLSIARALATDSEAYLFDDSFSALDYKTDAALRTEMNKHLRGATVIIVAQRVASIMNADKIICLADGRVAGQGTHAQLLETCPEYYDIAAGQLSADELCASANSHENECTNAEEKPNSPENFSANTSDTPSRENLHTPEKGGRNG